MSLKFPIFSRAVAVATAVALGSIFGLAVPALAHDTVEISVDGFTGAAPTSVDPAITAPLTFRDNGNVTINYVVNGLAFPSGELGRFTLHMRTNDNPNTNHEPTYPVAVGLGLNGLNLPLTMSPLTNISLTGLGNESTKEIVVNIDCSGGCPTGNGDSIDRQLQFSGTNLNTGVKVHVIVTLVHPPVGECLAAANFVTDQGWTQRVSSTEVITIANGRNAGTVRATTPYGQLSQDVVVSSACAETRYFDLKIELDNTWETNPNNNPGNAVFTYYSDEDIDLATYVPEVSAEKTPQGQQLCLANLYLDPGESLIATVHMQIQRGIAEGLLPPADPGFVFKAYVREPDATCGNGADILNLDDAEVSFTLR